MSEIKGQLLGMVLVLSAFGVILGVLIPNFETAANNVSKTISVDSTGSVTIKDQTTNKLNPVIA